MEQQSPSTRSPSGRRKHVISRSQHNDRRPCGQGLPRRCAPQEPPTHLQVAVPHQPVFARRARPTHRIEPRGRFRCGRSDAGGRIAARDRSGTQRRQRQTRHTAEHRYRSTAHHQHRPDAGAPAARCSHQSARPAATPRRSHPEHRLIRFRGCDHRTYREDAGHVRRRGHRHRSLLPRRGG